MIRSSRTLALACVAVSAVLIAGCGGGHHAKATVTATPTSSTPSPTPTTSTPAAAAAINPFTGHAPSKNAVVAVKIDDTENGQPQRAIDQADMVYVEQVEGGLTRLLAIYNTQLPVVEAVRSTRASDPELVEQFGAIDYVASGGGGDPLAVLDKSPLRTSINDRGGPGFTRDSNRNAPYNLESNLAVAAAALHGPTAKSIGLTFSNVPAFYNKTPVATQIRTTVGATAVSFDWSASLQRYVRLVDGVVQHAADGATIDTPNVIVQFCSVTPYPGDIDVDGNPSQYTHTVGTGKVVIFRNGHALTGIWTRKSATSPTLYSLHGRPLPVAPGGEWVLLVSNGTALS